MDIENFVCDSPNDIQYLKGQLFMDLCVRRNKKETSIYSYVEWMEKGKEKSRKEKCRK